MKTSFNLSRFLSLPAVCGVLSAVLAPAPAILAQSIPTLTVLHAFGNDPTGPSSPQAGLIQATDGNFYGTTKTGGVTSQGTVFKTTPDGTTTILYTFSRGTDGSTPVSRLLQASDGNFYGTTEQYGGPTFSGTVFKLTPAGVLTTLKDFSGVDGHMPVGDLIQTGDGTIYGTTYAGGTDYVDSNNTGVGTVFKITPDGAVASFASFDTATDHGIEPSGGLIQASDGNFYGTTTNGRHTASDGFLVGSGNVFKLTPDGVLTNFVGFDLRNKDPQQPNRLIQGSDGNFYCTSGGGGANGLGTVFKVLADGTFTILHSFTGQNGDGSNPASALVQASDGNFYGTTEEGGNAHEGTIFKVAPDGTFTTIYAFHGGSDGADPMGQLIEGKDGNLYGTTSGGGSGGSGVVFRLNIAPHPAFFTGEAVLSNGVYYLSFPNGNYFGYYSYLTDPNYIYHFDLGYEYVFDAKDSGNGVYLYDFASSGFFYTSPVFPFPYLYDFSLNSVVYYYPDPNNPGRYNTGGIRYFYEFANGQIISK